MQIYSLDSKYIENNIQTYDRKLSVQVFSTIESTNQYLLSKGFNNLICLSERQTKGRGRSNKVWFSPLKKNIYISISLPITPLTRKILPLSLVMGLCVARTLNSYHDGFQVKWPNDIYYDNNKISGVLIETIHYSRFSASLVVIGIGININTEMHVHTPYTSLYDITGEYYDRNQIVILLIKNITKYFSKYINFGLQGFTEEWRQHEMLYNKNIIMTYNNSTEKGKYLGIDSNGQILLYDNKIKIIPPHYIISDFES